MASAVLDTRNLANAVPGEHEAFDRSFACGTDTVGTDQAATRERQRRSDLVIDTENPEGGLTFSVAHNLKVSGRPHCSQRSGSSQAIRTIVIAAGAAIYIPAVQACRHIIGHFLNKVPLQKGPQSAKHDRALRMLAACFVRSRAFPLDLNQSLWVVNFLAKPHLSGTTGSLRAAPDRRRCNGQRPAISELLRVHPPKRRTSNNISVSGAGSLNKADNPHSRPAGHTFAGRVVVSVNDTFFRNIDPRIRRILPASEFAADECLKMPVHNAVLHHPAIRSVAAGLVGIRLPQASEPRRKILIGTRRRSRPRWPIVAVNQTCRGKCKKQPSSHPIYPPPVHSSVMFPDPKCYQPILPLWSART
jgi:hypothetical protein